MSRRNLHANASEHLEQNDMIASSHEQNVLIIESRENIKNFIDLYPNPVAFFTADYSLEGKSKEWDKLFCSLDNINKCPENLNDYFTYLPIESQLPILENKKKVISLNGFYFINKHSEKVTYNLKITPIYFKENSSYGIYIILSDITVLTNNKEELIKECDLYDDALHGSTYGLWSWDLNSDEVFFTESFKNLLGYTGIEFENNIEEWTGRIHPDDFKETIKFFKEQLKNSERFSTEFRLKTKNDGYRWFLVRGLTIAGKSGKSTKTSGSMADIDEKYTMEREILQKNKELNEFAHIVSHDLQAPLRHINHFATILKEDIEEVKQEKQKGELNFSISKITQACEKMGDLIKGLLNYSKSGGELSNLEFVDLNDVLNEVLDILEEEIITKNARFEIFELPTLKVDRRQMVQLFQNLIDNSLKFAKPGRPVTIQVQNMDIGGIHNISFSDNGTGIPENQIQNVFKVFQRSHCAGGVKGTGIGLSVCKKIMDSHHGDILVESHLGEGATFYLQFSIED